MERRFDAVCIGTCMLDISTDGLDFDTFLENEPNLAHAIGFQPGGDAINEATVLSRLGHKVGFQSRVGDDFIGRYLLERAAADGVDVSGVHMAKGCATAVNNILIGRNDKRVYTIARGGTSRTEFCVQDLDFDAIGRARLVSFGSIFVHEKFDDAALARVFRAAKAGGAITCADVGLSGLDCSLETMRESMQYLDYIFPNDMEAAFLSKRQEPDEMADYFLNLGVGTVVIKFGGRGSLVKSRTERFFQEAFYAEPVDTTGAGDCYAAGFLSGLLRGKSLRACARLASAAGALAVGRVGATAGIASRAQLEAFLKDHP